MILVSLEMGAEVVYMQSRCTYISTTEELQEIFLSTDYHTPENELIIGRIRWNSGINLNIVKLHFVSVGVS